MKRIYFLFLKKPPKYNQNNYGFTMIELIVVIMIIAILAAVMAPSWLAFTNRQRLGKANEAILNAIRDTQSLAKTTKQSYTMIIRQVKSSGVNQNLPEVAIYRTSNYPDPPTISNPPQPSSDTQLPWKKLGSDLGLNQRQFAVCSNLLAMDSTTAKANANTVYNTSSTFTTTPIADPVCDLTTPRIIRFDYLGQLNPFGSQPPQVGSGANSELKISVINIANSSTLPSNTAQKCVVISTILGATRIDEGAYTYDSTTGTGKGCQ